MTDLATLILELGSRTVLPTEPGDEARLAWTRTVPYPLPQGEIEKFGEWLVRRGLIDRAELFTALDVGFRYGCRLGDSLVWLELLDRRRVEAEARRFEAYRGVALQAGDP